METTVQRIRPAHEVTLAPGVLAPRVARRMVRSACDDAGLPRTVADDAEMVIDELVTIALRGSGPPMTASIDITDDSVTLRVHLERLPTDVRGDRIETSASQLGWDVIRGLSSAWGHACTECGRAVWARLRLPAVDA